MADRYCTRCDGLQRTSPNAVPCTRCGGTGYEPANAPQPPAAASVSERARELLAEEWKRDGHPAMAHALLNADLLSDKNPAIRAIERALSSPRQEGEAVASICLVTDRRLPHFAAAEIQLYGGYEPKIGDKLYTHPSTAASTQGLQAEIDRLNAIINTPQANDFLRAVSTEAEHQRQRWGSDHDAGKTPADWFWLVGYLAGKALHAHAASDLTKAEHHIITTAAALANWHMAMFGNTDMRPGIDGESRLTSPTTGADGGGE